MIFITQDLPLLTVLLISTIMISVIRMTVYYKEDLAKDIAKLFPLALLVIFLTEFGNFHFISIVSNLSLIPDFFSDIWVYLIFILAIEVILRFIDLIFKISGIEGDDE